MNTITADELKRLMNKQSPDYRSKTSGYILVNTLPEEYFRKEHIPHSLNVTINSIGELRRCFESSKQIIVYCASHSCDLSTKAGNELMKMGFTNVTDFAGGMSAWNQAGGKVQRGNDQPDISVSSM